MTKAYTLPKNFYKLPPNEQNGCLIDAAIFSEAELQILKKETALRDDLIATFIENPIGCFPIPLGLAVNFVIDHCPYVIPMAIEETSVIAAASKTAKWISEQGSLSTANEGGASIGQIQIARVKDFANLEAVMEEQKKYLIGLANTGILKTQVKRGGGLKEITLRKLSRGDGSLMAIIHLYIDTQDAMGANIINQTCELLKPLIEALTGESVGMCILSNLVDSKLTHAKVVIRDIDKDLGQKIEEASLFAKLDPYRAATNNKGVMNGMDGLLIATGNDWRAVEAGVHAYAAHSGQYSSITEWTMQGKDLVGELVAPIIVGIVGGVTKLHPVAQICLRVLKVKTASHLARIVAAVGIAQNLGALRALVTEGITRGHMKLHLANLAISIGASNEELPLVKQSMEQYFLSNQRITQTDAVELLSEIRKRRGLILPLHLK